MEIIELNHIALAVKDVELSKTFYKNLGLKALERPSFDFPGAWFKLGPQQELHLIESGNTKNNSAKRGVHYALGIVSIEGARKFLEGQNISYTGPFIRPDGIQQLYVVDPDGYYIELCEVKKVNN